LQQTLAAHGAKQISYEYGDDGKVHGVAFAVTVHAHRIRVQLPARIEQAQAVLKRQWDEGMISHKRGRERTYGDEQAYRVAWRNILDWVQAQMALLEIGMAKMEEIFLPYMLDIQGRTFFERMEQRGFLLETGKVRNRSHEHAMLIGYARVSTNEQNLDLQRDALQKAGVSEKHIFTDKITGTKAERRGLAQALTHLREGDTFVVWRLSRL
jgi:hypothetical protein